MNAEHLLTSLLEGGFNLAITDSGLKIAPSSLLSTEQREAIKTHKPALIGFLTAGQRAIDASRTCPTCAKRLTSSGKYHHWCDACHYDLHEVIPADQRANYCKSCHNPLRNGACEACRNQASSTIVAQAKNATANVR